MRTGWAIAIAIILMASVAVPAMYIKNTNTTPDTTPFISIDPIGNHTAGDLFVVSGSTNLPATETITLTFVNEGDLTRPHMRSEESSFSSGWKNVSEIPISAKAPGPNRWSVNVTDFAAGNLPGYHCLIKIQDSSDGTKCDPMSDLWMVMASHDPDIPINFDTSTEFSFFPAASASPSIVQKPVPEVTTPNDSGIQETISKGSGLVEVPLVWMM